MEPIMMGVLALGLVGGLGAILAFGKGATFLRTLGIGSGGALVSGIFAVYTKSWAMITGAFYGHLGIIGYAFVGVLVILICVWGWNAYSDYTKGRPIGFVD